MQYFLCPRCNFKVPSNRRACQTCGYEVPKVASSVSVDDDNSLSKKSNVWAKVLGFGSQSKPEGGHEKPALG